jgi:hypothetical protein
MVRGVEHIEITECMIYKLKKNKFVVKMKYSPYPIH